MKTNRIQGLTVMECMTDLDPALVAEAELDACFLPPLTAYQKKEHKKARREAARERREENPFFRFAGSGAGAVCISLVVAFALIAGIVYFINYAPKNPVGPGPGGQPEGTQAPTWGEGQIPTGEIDAAYTISTEQRMYETSPKRIAVTMRAKNPGVDIDYFHAFRIESLTDPAGELDFDCLWTEEWMERAEPVGKDEYAAWTKSVSINGVMPDGIYRIHHMEYDKDKGYVSAAFCDFAVGAYYGELLETGRTDALPDTTYPEAAEKPYTITATIGKNAAGDRGFLSVTYTAVQPGTGLKPIFEIGIRKIDGTGSAGFELITSSEAVEILAPEADEYATFSHAWEILNPEAIVAGTYRVYALNYQKQCIAYADVVVGGGASGEEEQPPVESTPAVPPVVDAEFSIQTASITRRDNGTLAVIITYIADEPGVTIWGPSTEFRMEKLSGEANPEAIRFLVTEEALECATPSDAHDGYAVWTKLNPAIIENPDALLPGTYRITALTRGGEVMDFVDVSWDGKASKRAPSFTISVPDVMQYGTKTLTVTYRATEPGKPLTQFGSIVLERADGTSEVGHELLTDTSLLTAFGPESPDAYAEGSISYTIENYGSMRDGNYRVSVIMDGEVVASAEFWLNTAVAG